MTKHAAKQVHCGYIWLMLLRLLDTMTVIAFLALLVSSVIVSYYAFIAWDAQKKAGWRSWRERWKHIPEKIQRFHFFALYALIGLMLLGVVLRYMRK